MSVSDDEFTDEVRRLEGLIEKLSNRQEEIARNRNSNVHYLRSDDSGLREDLSITQEQVAVLIQIVRQQAKRMDTLERVIEHAAGLATATEERAA